MAAAVTAQVALALAAAQRLRHQLERTGAWGQAHLLRTQQTGAPMQRFAPFFVEVHEQPGHTVFPLQCSFTTWSDTSKIVLMEGAALPAM